MEQATNGFLKGLLMDTSPLILGNDTLTDALNGTFVTMNGNEVILQNDMGNRRVQDAYLPAGYTPVGIKEHGGIIYIAAYNPITGRGQIGSFPSPEVKAQSPSTKTCDLDFDKFLETFSYNGIDNFVKNKQIIQAINSDIVFRAGDKFTVYCPEIWNEIAGDGRIFGDVYINGFYSNTQNIVELKDFVNSFNMDSITEEGFYAYGNRLPDGSYRSEYNNVYELVIELGERTWNVSHNNSVYYKINNQIYKFENNTYKKYKLEYNSDETRLYTILIGVIDEQNNFKDISNSLERWNRDQVIPNLTPEEKLKLGYFIASDNLNSIIPTTLDDKEFLENRLSVPINTYSEKLVSPLFVKYYINTINSFDYNLIANLEEDDDIDITIDSNIYFDCPLNNIHFNNEEYPNIYEASKIVSYLPSIGVIDEIVLLNSEIGNNNGAYEYILSEGLYKWNKRVYQPEDLYKSICGESEPAEFLYFKNAAGFFTESQYPPLPNVEGVIYIEGQQGRGDEYTSFNKRYIESLMYNGQMIWEWGDRILSLDDIFCVGETNKKFYKLTEHYIQPFSHYEEAYGFTKDYDGENATSYPTLLRSAPFGSILLPGKYNEDRGCIFFYVPSSGNTCVVIKTGTDLQTGSATWLYQLKTFSNGDVYKIGNKYYQLTGLDSHAGTWIEVIGPHTEYKWIREYPGLNTVLPGYWDGVEGKYIFEAGDTLKRILNDGTYSSHTFNTTERFIVENIEYKASNSSAVGGTWDVISEVEEPKYYKFNTTTNRWVESSVTPEEIGTNLYIPAYDLRYRSFENQNWTLVSPKSYLEIEKSDNNIHYRMSYKITTNGNPIEYAILSKAPDVLAELAESVLYLREYSSFGTLDPDKIKNGACSLTNWHYKYDNKQISVDISLISFPLQGEVRKNLTMEIVRGQNIVCSYPICSGTFNTLNFNLSIDVSNLTENFAYSVKFKYTSILNVTETEVYIQGNSGDKVVWLLTSPLFNELYYSKINFDSVYQSWKYKVENEISTFTEEEQMMDDILTFTPELKQNISINSVNIIPSGDVPDILNTTGGEYLQSYVRRCLYRITTNPTLKIPNNYPASLLILSSNLLNPTQINRDKFTSDKITFNRIEETDYLTKQLTSLKKLLSEEIIENISTDYCLNSWVDGGKLIFSELNPIVTHPTFSKSMTDLVTFSIKEVAGSYKLDICPLPSEGNTAWYGNNFTYTTNYATLCTSLKNAKKLNDNVAFVFTKWSRADYVMPISDEISDFSNTTSIIANLGNNILVALGSYIDEHNGVMIDLAKLMAKAHINEINSDYYYRFKDNCIIDTLYIPNINSIERTIGNDINETITTTAENITLNTNNSPILFRLTSSRILKSTTQLILSGKSEYMDKREEKIRNYNPDKIIFVYEKDGINIVLDCDKDGNELSSDYLYTTINSGGGKLVLKKYPEEYRAVKIANNINFPSYTSVPFLMPDGIYKDGTLWRKISTYKGIPFLQLVHDENSAIDMSLYYLV